MPVLLVDDDPQWARATARLLETTEPKLEVTIANSLTAGREVLDAEPWRCIICDYQLGDGTGFDLLEDVQEETQDCPFLLVTGRGDEQIASQAINRGVTDYIIKNHDDSEATLIGNRVRNAIASANFQRQLSREYQSKTAILDLLRSTTLSEGLLGQFCRILVEENQYTGAWIGAVDTDSERAVVPRAVTGCQAYLEAVTGSAGIRSDSADPATKVLSRDEPVVVSVPESQDSEGVPTAYKLVSERWAELAREHGFTTAAALPITYDDVRIGTLCVYLSPDDPPLTGRRWKTLTEYADVIGHAQHNEELAQSLLGDPSQWVELEITDPSLPLAELTSTLGGSTCARVLSTRRQDDGTLQYLTMIADTSIEEIEAAAEESGTFELKSPVETADGIRCDVYSTVFPPEATLVIHGATVEEVTATDGTVNLISAVPDHATATTIIDTLKEQFETVTMTALWNTERESPEELSSPLAPLTDKQESVLRQAYFRGYFERPRQVSASELAQTLGIARATMTQHLRAAQRKVFDELLDE
jgi:DNA-binding NarL/FixJ family response regulator